MDGMEPEPEEVSRHFGDYPHGSYWSAVRPEGYQEPEVSDEARYSYTGSTLRIMWDEGAGPLWADDGLLDDDTEWMRRALGLSDSLCAGLLAWHSGMTGLCGVRSADVWTSRKRQLDAEGRELAERLQGEVGDRYRVTFEE